MAAGSYKLTAPTRNDQPHQNTEDTMAFTYYDQPEFEFDKDVDIDVVSDIDFNTEATVTIAKNVDVDVAVVTHVEGNTAFLVADVEAIGKDTFVEVDASVLAVENQLSSVSIHAVAIVG
jgi:preprotein translocase subunit SecB